MKIKELINITLSVLMVLALAGEVLAVSPSSTKKIPKKITKDEAINISADHVEQLGDKDIIRAWDRVFITHKGRFIKADKVQINTKTGIGKASGHVVVGSEDGTQIKSKQTHFNLKSKKGKMFDAAGQIGKQYHVKGKEVRKLDDNHYQADKASLTTCTGKIPDWLLEVNALDLKVGDRALFQGAVFKIRDVPVFYFPLGYVPLDNDRKSGFLMPSVGTSSVNGITVENSFFWAINRWSDATFYVDYLEKRGVQFGTEYRYSPSKGTTGEFRATYLDDNVTNEPFWKVDGWHKQRLPGRVTINGRVDLNSNNNYVKTFIDNTEERTRRSSDSFASIDKSWSDNTLDIIGRFRQSTEGNRDDTFVLAPQVTSKTQFLKLWNTPVFFTQESSYTGFLVDLDTRNSEDDFEFLHRLDIHPQIAMPLRVGSLFTLTPKVGIRETFYSKGLRLNQTVLESFSRELIDVGAVLEGPKFEKIFSFDDDKHLFKHIIEPRVYYNFIPDMDEADRNKIRVLDDVDEIGQTNTIKYSLIQRLFAKNNKKGESNTRQTLRFEVSQIYDINEADRLPTPNNPSRPFSDLRFDLDSRIMESLLINVDTEFDVYRGVFETLNIEVGIKPTDWLSLLVERRHSLHRSTFLLASMDLQIDKGWHLQFTTRYDEEREQFKENDISVMYNDPCKCWGVGLDFIRRNNINNGINDLENKFMFTLELRGIGSLSTARPKAFIHRTFN